MKHRTPSYRLTFRRQYRKGFRRSKPTRRAGMAFIAAVWALVAMDLIWLFWPAHSS